MNFNVFKKFQLTWWQAGFFKSAAVSLGILLGIYFFSFLSQYTLFFWVMLVVSSSVVTYYWVKQ